MSARSAAALAWLSWVVGCGAIAASGLIFAANPAASTTQSYGILDAALWSSSWVGLGLVGALIVSRRPENRIGWILCGLTLGVGFGLLTRAYARYALVTAPGTVPLGGVAAWVGSWVVVPTLALVLALILTYPSGRASTQLGRWLVRVLVAVTTLETLVYAFRPGPIEGDTPPFNPLGVEPLGPVLDPATGILGFALATIGVVGAGHAVVRFRRSRGVERQQFRWFVYAVAAFPILFGAVVLLEEFVGSQGLEDRIVAIVFVLGGNGLAAAIYVAVTRHGLFEIDRVLNRTVVYAVVVAVLGGVYVSLAVALQTLLRPVTEGSDLAVAGSTLAVAAAFGPVRRRVQQFVDRRFNRRRYDAAKTAEEFAASLRDEVQLSSLVLDLQGVVRRTVQPAHVSLWLRPKEGRG